MELVNFMIFNCKKIFDYKYRLDIEVKKKYPKLQIDCPLNNDVWAYSLIGPNGFFIEIGAGRSGNSTLILEKYFGWHGVLVEPIPFFLEYLKNLRTKSKILKEVISSRDNEIIEFFEFTYDPHYSSIDLTSITKKIMHEELKEVNNKKFIDKHIFSSISLSSVIKQEKITKIDYLALDAENSELQILQGLNFNIIRPKLISSECSSVIDFLITKNYKQVNNPYKDKNIQYEYYFVDKFYNFL